MTSINLGDGTEGKGSKPSKACMEESPGMLCLVVAFFFFLIAGFFINHSKIEALSLHSEPSYRVTQSPRSSGGSRRPTSSPGSWRVLADVRCVGWTQKPQEQEEPRCAGELGGGGGAHGKASWEQGCFSRQAGASVVKALHAHLWQLASLCFGRLHSGRVQTSP